MDSIAGAHDTTGNRVEDDPWYRLGSATVRLKLIEKLAELATADDINLDEPISHARHWDYIEQIKALAGDA